MVAFESRNLLAILDGHGGRECADFMADQFSNLNLGGDAQKDYITVAFCAADDAFRAQNKPSGCTCCMALLNETNRLMVANLGDSRAILTRAGKVIEQTTDHSLRTSEAERQRVEQSGGQLTVNKITRSNVVVGCVGTVCDSETQEFQEEGQLPDVRLQGVAVSRAFGTYTSPLGFSRGPNSRPLKDAKIPHAERLISCVPDIYSWEGLQGNDLLILASDGIWDVVAPEQAMEIVESVLNLESEASSAVDAGISEDSELDLEKAAQTLVRHALDGGSMDNCSCVVAIQGRRPKCTAAAEESAQSVPENTDGSNRIPRFNLASQAEQDAISVQLGYGENVLTDAMRGLETDEILSSSNSCSTGKLLLGTVGDAFHAPFLRWAGVSHIVNCAAEIEEAHPEYSRDPIDNNGSGCSSVTSTSFRLAWRDSEEQGKTEQKNKFRRLRQATRFIHVALQCQTLTESQLPVVLVHCVQGISRSATVVVAYLMEFEKLHMDEAVTLVRNKHAVALKPFRFQEMLRAFQYVLDAERQQKSIT